MKTFSDNRHNKTSQFLKMPVAELSTRVQQELATNPALIKQRKYSLTNLMVDETDFIITTNSDRLEIEINSQSDLSIGQPFNTWLSNAVKQNKTDPITVAKIRFVQEKINEAKRFIKTVETRQALLLRTMKAILDYQYDFFVKGDPVKLKPMVLGDIATRTNLSISAISRAVSGKHVRTDFGQYPLKYFFSVGIGQDGRSRRNRTKRANTHEVKNVLEELIASESKRAPLTDEQLQKILTERGYYIARRTVAKYREENKIPVMWARRQV